MCIRDRYLWSLYQTIDNPLDTEYLSLFVINDNNSRKGCLSYLTDDNVQYVNLSVDLEEDYNRCLNLLKKINKPWNEINLQDIIKNIDLLSINLSKEVKLPTEVVTLEQYIKNIKNLKYKVKKTYEYF